MRRLAGIAVALLALLGAALLALVLAALAVNQGWQRERLRAALEAELREALGDEVSVGSIPGSLLPRLEVRKLRVGPAQAPTLVADRVTVGLGWRRSLATRSLVLRRVKVVGAELALRRDERGAWQLPDWLAGGESGTGGEAAGFHVDRVELEQTRLRVAWSEQGSPAALRASGSATLRDLSLPPQPGEQPSGQVRLQLEALGAARRWLEHAQLAGHFEAPRFTLESLELSGGPTPPLRLTAPALLVWGEERLAVHDLSLESATQRLTLEGGLSRQGFQQLHASLRELDVTLAGRVLGGRVQPGGRLSGELQLDGPYTRPEGSVDLVWSQPSLGPAPEDWRAERATVRASGDGREIRLEALTLEGVPGGPLRLAQPARLRIRDDAVELVGLELRSNGQALLANGEIARDAFHGLSLQLRNLDVGVAGRLLGLAAEPGGTLVGDVSLDGPFERPTGEVSLRWRDPRLYGAQARLLALRAALDGEVARLDATLERVAGESAHAEASLPARELRAALAPDSPTRTRRILPEGLRVDLHSDAFALGALHPLLPEPAQRLEGTLSAHLALSGGERPSIGGTLALADATLALPGREPIHDLHAELALEPRPGALDLRRFQLEAPALRVDASGVIEAGGPAPLAISLSAPDLEALASSYGLDAPLIGALDASASLRGDWPRPSVDARATWTHPAPDTQVPHRAELELQSDQRDLRGSLSVEQAGRVAADGQLVLPYPAAGLPAILDGVADARLTLEAEDFDLATLSPLLPRLVRDLRGHVDARLALQPGADPPVLDGVVQLRDGSVRVPTLRQSFEPIQGSFRLQRDAIRIDELHVGRDTRGADISGELRLDDSLRPSRFDVALVLSQLPLARSRPLTADASGRLQLTGPPDALRLAGKVELSGARVRLVDPGDPALREFEVVTSDAERRSRRDMQERERRPDAFQRARIDVDLTVPRNTWVRGRGADIDLAGTLRVEKDPEEPVRVSGRVATVRGTYRFQGKRFDLRRGTVTFTGSSEPDPTLDIEAEHRVRDVTIVIEISGTASEPVVSLSSEPSLPEDDVLSYLFFGRPTDELGSKEPTGSLDRAAAAFAAGVALRKASRVVEETLPIDTVDVQIDEQGSSGSVGVGKYLTDDFFVRYERGFGEDAADAVRFELRLTDHWSIETDASTDESAGADLVWSYDY
jgi:autotransporter translocation and assembly factor TamB